MTSGTETPFPITLFSFGYKYGSPQDVNLLVDVRFLNNPFHDKKLRSFTGLKTSISEFVLNNESGQGCLQHLYRTVKFLGEQLKQNNKEEFRIGIGCTGGHHRSVAVVEALAKLIGSDFETVIHFHRDIKNESH
jgi:UPF0042 nucleotide-binding protein